MDNVLDLVDQATFDIGRATGVSTQLQCLWVYDGPVDIEGLRQFHGHLQRGRLSRCIERSPLRVGRHRWVSAERSSEMEVVAAPRPREEFDAWLGEQASARLDCEQGPGWHLAVLPFTDGGAGVSLLVSHCLIDGVGLCEAVADAVLGRDDPISWPAAASRRRWPALREDARQAGRDTRGISQAVVAGVRLARRTRRGAKAAPPLPTRPLTLPAGADEPVTLATTTIFVDADEWEARAHSLGGTSNALLVGLAGHVAQRLGRITAGGSLTLKMPVNERVAGDTRANANSDIAVAIDPAHATTDLREIRAAVKQALIDYGEEADERRALLSIVPLLPQRLFRRMITVVAGVTSSNLGVVNPATSRPDGTDADYFAMKILYSGVSKAMMHRFGGRLFLLAGRARGHVSISVTGYQPGHPNTNDSLRQEMSRALSDFSLAGTHFGAHQDHIPLKEPPRQLHDPGD
ncbi:hypothetical protein A5707_01835 [Mycobacterium kyorinense]|uniref:Diacylglycerol O-acyltransferase n=1 Tax=Mycobacterium kyorinense TaxID=487514 RepID=A0A1A2Z8N6_9MYCO|nr:hypothetical protein [Mycobacterium kyorinense]OBI45461.1 hypothetical protein A5707_01835 [Mycobacterium kyorinense]